MKKLSILITTLWKRRPELNELLKVLEPQKTDDVEIIINTDNGSKSVGHKRNELLNAAQGDYICFVDDDDMIVSDYIEKILKAIETNPDVVGIEGIFTNKGQDPHRFIHSIKYHEWFESGGIYYRCPNHWNPVKREFALLTMFPDVYCGEDRDYSMRLFPLLKSEVFIQGAIYFYQFDADKTEAQKKR